MARIVKIAKIKLIEDEANWFAIAKQYSPHAYSSSISTTDYSDAVVKLFRSLKSRGVIPDVRLEYFKNPTYVEKGKKSHKAIFEMNGTKGLEIVKHPHFLPFLLYFINGPDLPQDIIDEFSTIASQWDFPSHSDAYELQNFVRGAIRSHSLDPHKSAEEFFKLAIECGFSLDGARLLRTCAMAVR